MADKATATHPKPDESLEVDLRKVRGWLALVMVGAGVLALVLTYLTAEGIFSDAWHRQFLSFADWCWFGLIATTCTLIAVRCVRSGVRHIGKRINRLDRELTQKLDTAVDAMHMTKLSDDMRRRDG